MKLFSLLKDLNYRAVGCLGVDILGLYHSDVSVKEGGLFFCLRGTRVDGSDFVHSAVSNGAVAVVTEQEIPMLGVTQVVVKNAREAMSKIACKFYGNPTSKLKIIAVTGTNGKTTISTMISNSLNFLGKKSAVIGTNGIFFGETKIDTGMTTPDPIDLQKYFSLMVKNKIEYVCMEVSAHAIDLHKIDGFKFEVSVFSNLTEDHLDYFKTMQKYYNAKLKLFNESHSKFAIINADDEYGKMILQSINIPKFTYAIDSKADFKTDKTYTFERGQQFYLNNNRIVLKMFGKFNVYNALACYACLQALGFVKDDVISAIESLKPVDGRFNVYSVGGRFYVVDYAHTPDGLKNVLLTCKELANGYRIISVFGCGGNRETQKRSIMGEISSKYADLTIITSDNSRFEKREDIAKDILKGFLNDNYLVELDRTKAIKKSFEVSAKGDVILVAGKGCEPYIDECGVKSPYLDKNEILKLGE